MSKYLVTFDGELSDSPNGSLRNKAVSALSELKRGDCLGSEWIGWFDYPQKYGFSLLESVEKVARSRHVHFDSIIVIGIGGSYLGTRAVYEMLVSEFHLSIRDPAAKFLPILFAGHNLSERSLLDVLAILDRLSPLVNVISKNGTTLETSCAFRVVREYIENRFGVEQGKRRIIITTDASKGALRKITEKNGFTSFDVPRDVGGRYSVLSAVGQVPLRLSGFNVSELLRGADSFFRELDGDCEDHPLFHYVEYRHHCFGLGKVVESFVYLEPGQRSFVEWLKQLFGESEGKDGRGIFPTGFALTTDLHSLGQFVQQGSPIIFETFIRFDPPSKRENTLRVPQAKDDDDGLNYLAGRSLEDLNHVVEHATLISHRAGGVPVCRINLPALHEFGIGYAFAFFQTACALSSALFGVNPFDQPGVEHYKREALRLLGAP